MKKVVQVTEVDGEGFEALLDKQVLIYCMSYIYSGKLTGVNKTCILLENAKIVYDAGEATAKGFTTSEKYNYPLYIQTAAIESFSQTDKT
jgi:hypothetical protein